MPTPSPKDDLLTLATVLEEETEFLHGPLPKDHPVGASEAVRTASLFRHIHACQPKRAGLCFSGGGIRSATFGDERHAFINEPARLVAV